MTIKYKLGFTIDSEVMFMLLSKFLPIENLSVEEVVERPAPDSAIRFDKRFDLPKPVRKSKRNYGEPGNNVDLTRGVNAIIMAVLLDGKKHSPLELKEAMAKTAYSVNGLGSRLERLRHFGFVHKLRKGEWAATLKGLDGAKQSESVA